MTHLDAATLRGYRDRTLPPRVLIDADEHLSGCLDCRGALVEVASSDAAQAMIESFIDDEHLSYETLAAWVDDELSPMQRRRASEHLEHCAQCAGDLADLQDTAKFAVRRRARTLGWPVAAAIALIVAGAAWFLTRVPQAASTTPQPMIRGAELRALTIPPDVRALRSPRGTLMGGEAAAFEVVAPAGTFVRATRPSFSWTPIGSDAAYQVEIYDSNGDLAVSSGDVHDTMWTADRDLQRGHEYQWQVVTVRDGKRVVAPRPPAGTARFRVIDDAAAARVARISGSPLARAEAYAREGLLDDARAELDALPDSPQVRMLKQSLDAR